MDSFEETGCQTPEGPILCVNNCGFFGSAATMNMCSKCHKDSILKQEQAKLAASSIGSILNGGPTAAVDLRAEPAEEKSTLQVAAQALASSSSMVGPAAKARESPSRCNACQKRVGLTGFECRCGNVFCAMHRHADKHKCEFDYQTAARDAIARANPVVKAAKLNDKA